MTPTTTSTNGTRTTAMKAASSDGLGAQLAYLTRALKVPTIAACWEQMAEQARDQNWSHEEFLAALLARQVADREAAGTTMRIRTAHFPRSKRWRTSTSTTCPRCAATYLLTWRRGRSCRKPRT